jgi:hypothetical protein
MFYNLLKKTLLNRLVLLNSSTFLKTGTDGFLKNSNKKTQHWYRHILWNHCCSSPGTTTPWNTLVTEKDQLTKLGHIYCSNFFNKKVQKTIWEWWEWCKCCSSWQWMHLGAHSCMIDYSWWEWVWVHPPLKFCCDVVE